MSIKAFDALNAYGQAQNRSPALGGLEEGLSIESASGGKAANAFGSVVENLLGSVGTTTHTAEVQSAKAVTRTGDLLDVASAVNNAELTIETVVAVRDKMVNAYQEILRMPI